RWSVRCADDTDFFEGGENILCRFRPRDLHALARRAEELQQIDRPAGRLARHAVEISARVEDVQLALAFVNASVRRTLDRHWQQPAPNVVNEPVMGATLQ